MDQYVKYNHQLHTLICRQHKYGLSPKWIERHFRKLHKAIPLETRQKIVTYAKSLNLWKPEHVNDLPSPLEPIAELTIIPGLRCQYDICQDLCSTEESMEKHCREHHGWKKIDGKKWIAQRMQTIFPSSYRK